MTTTITDESIDVLNDLVENAKDGEYGFTQCAEHLQAASLKEHMMRRAGDCRGAASEFHALVLKLGGKPAEHGTALGALHRGWISVKDALTPDSDRGLMNEAERGEDLTMSRYRKALKADLTPEVRDMVQRLMQIAQAGHDETKRLRDSTTL